MEQQLISNVRYMGVVPMVIMALMLVLKNRGRVKSAVYNHSRWMLVVATLLLAVHFLIQYIWHLREQSVTLCWTVNLTFYVVSTPLYNMAELNLLRAGHHMKTRYWRNALFMVLCYVILAIGYFTHTLVDDDKPWQTVTFLVALIYFFKVIELSCVLNKEMKVAYTRLTDRELAHRHQALRYTARVMRWIILLSLASPWVGMSPSLLLNAIYGMTIFVLLIWFQIKFLQYGENMTECIEVNDKILEATMTEKAPPSNPFEAEGTKADERDEEVQRRIEQWVNDRCFTNPKITIGEALQEMGITATALNYYLEQHTPVDNYRRWLPYLRIEEAKRIMTEHPDYSLEAIAADCGYANSSNFSRAFKTQEGMTPGQWLSAQKGDL